jgi:hypothetical protein
MPVEAPGRVATWMGYQIVRAYMKKRGPENLRALVKEKDAQEILNKSGYRPPRQ